MQQGQNEKSAGAHWHSNDEQKRGMAAEMFCNFSSCAVAIFSKSFLSYLI